MNCEKSKKLNVTKFQTHFVIQLQPQKLKEQQKSKTKNFIKLKNSNCDKTGKKSIFDISNYKERKKKKLYTVFW